MPKEEKNLVSTARGELANDSGVNRLLSKIRPEWKDRSLIERVKRLIPVDPSSACQRLLNAAIQDLKEKIVYAGIDIAREAAATHKLPSINTNEDVLDRYSTWEILSLAYRMGLLARVEWKRLRRVYDIRRDLEHEDDEYEASGGECIYVFESCVEIVLSRDPISLLKVTDVKELVEAPTPAVPSTDFLNGYERAPHARQKQICEFLISTALNTNKPESVRQNAIEMLASLKVLTLNPVKIELAQSLQEKIGKKSLDLTMMKIATAGGFNSYLRQAQLEDFFNAFHKKLISIGYQFSHHEKHGDILDDLEDLGGLVVCPEDPRQKIVLWLVLCYLGEPGGYGTWGRNRAVFYSDAAAPGIEKLIKDAGKAIKEDLEETKKDNRVKVAIGDQHIARRYEKLLDFVGKEE